MEFSYTGSELEAMTLARNYYRWIFRSCVPYLGRRVIEVGAGIGTFSSLLLDVDSIETVILVEPAWNLIPALQSLQSGTRVTVIHGHLEDVPTTCMADSIVLVNVLEHVEDPASFLRVARARLAPAGRLLVFVPAGPRLFGTLDAAFGHHRRYTQRSLGSSLAAAGFTVRLLRYMNVPGVVSWFVAGKILRQRTLAARQVQLYDRFIVPWLSKLESRWCPPFGQSLFAVAQSEDGGTA